MKKMFVGLYLATVFLLSLPQLSKASQNYQIVKEEDLGQLVNQALHCRYLRVNPKYCDGFVRIDSTVPEGTIVISSQRTPYDQELKIISRKAEQTIVSEMIEINGINSLHVNGAHPDKVFFKIYVSPTIEDIVLFADHMANWIFYKQSDYSGKNIIDCTELGKVSIVETETEFPMSWSTTQEKHFENDISPLFIGCNEQKAHHFSNWLKNTFKDEEQSKSIFQQLKEKKDQNPEDFFSLFKALYKDIIMNQTYCKFANDFLWLISVPTCEGHFPLRDSIYHRIEEKLDTLDSRKRNLIEKMDLFELFITNLFLNYKQDLDSHDFSFNVITNFVKGRQANWNFHLITGIMDTFKQIGVGGHIDALHLAYPHLTSDLSNDIVALILRLSYFYSPGKKEEFDKKLNIILDQQHLLTADKFRSYFSKEAKKVSMQGDRFRHIQEQENFYNNCNLM